MQAVQTRRVLWAPLTSARTRRKLGFQRRRLRLWAWLILFPYTGPLPQMSKARAILVPLRPFKIREVESAIIPEIPLTLHEAAMAKLLFEFIPQAGYNVSMRRCPRVFRSAPVFALG